MSTCRFASRVVVGIWLTASLAACSSKESPAPASGTTTATRDDHLALGNPSGATADTGQPANYLLVKPQYAMSYHRDRGIPNWVSWHLSSARLGSAPRQDDFRADTDLPTGWY